jgi:hypothetical protein
MNKNTGRVAIYRGPAAKIHGPAHAVLEDLDNFDGDIMFVVIPFEEFTEGWEEYND